MRTTFIDPRSLFDSFAPGPRPCKVTGFSEDGLFPWDRDKRTFASRPAGFTARFIDDDLTAVWTCFDGFQIIACGSCPRTEIETVCSALRKAGFILGLA